MENFLKHPLFKELIAILSDRTVAAPSHGAFSDPRQPWHDGFISSDVIKLLAVYPVNNGVIHNVLTNRIEGDVISNDVIIIIGLP